jgi:hypothetical protein
MHLLQADERRKARWLHQFAVQTVTLLGARGKEKDNYERFTLFLSVGGEMTSVHL